MYTTPVLSYRPVRELSCLTWPQVEQVDSFVGALFQSGRHCLTFTVKNGKVRLIERPIVAPGAPIPPRTNNRGPLRWLAWATVEQIDSLLSLMCQQTCDNSAVARLSVHIEDGHVDVEQPTIIEELRPQRAA